MVKLLSHKGISRGGSNLHSYYDKFDKLSKHLSIKVPLVAAVVTAILVVSQFVAAAEKTEKVSDITSVFPSTLVAVAVVGLHAAVILGSVIGAAVAVAVIRRAVAAVITVPDDVHVPLVSFVTTLATGV